MRKISIKENIISLKPVVWIKSIFMVLIGIETTRFGVGVGRANKNIYYGSLIFVLISVAGMIVVYYLSERQKGIEKHPIGYFKFIGGISAAFYGIGFGLAIYYTLIYNINSLNLFLLAFVGIFGFLSIYYGRDSKYKGILKNVVISVSFSFGVFYGAALNVTFIPITIYLFFGAVFLLQISKDLINDCKHIDRDRRENIKSFPIFIGEEKAQKLSMILDLLIILFLVIPMFPDFPNILAQMLYTLVTIIAIAFVGVAAIFSFRMNKSRTYYRIIKIFLRCGIFLAFTAFILANF
ncbi:MAG: UbiA family prenyltransferase [Candidatus Hermodarchaeota archaeon]